MTDPIETGSTPPPRPSTLPAALRWGRWALFVLAVAAAAIVTRQAAERASSEPAASVSESIPPGPMRPVVESEAPAEVPEAAPADPTEAAALTPMATTAGGPLDRSYELGPGAEFRVDVAVGDIQATRGVGTRARLVVELEPGVSAASIRIVESDIRAGLVRLSIEPVGKDGGGLSFFGGRIRFSSDFPVHAGIRNVRVEVPAGVRAGLSTGAGDIDVTGIDSDVDAETGTGDISVRHAVGVQASTGAGDVKLADISGSVHVEAGTGDVVVSGGAGGLHVETGAGGIQVRGATGNIHLESGMGGIDLVVPGVTGPIQVETGMGEIELTVESGGFDLNAASGLGSVEVTTNGQTESSGSMGTELRRVVGGGGPNVRLESGAGSIDVHAPASGSSRTAT